MGTIWKHEMLPLPNSISEIEKLLNDKSEDDWELVNIFQHSKIKEFINLADMLESSMFAVLRKKATA
jgi:hypothetical protein